MRNGRVYKKYLKNRLFFFEYNIGNSKSTPDKLGPFLFFRVSNLLVFTVAACTSEKRLPDPGVEIFDFLSINFFDNGAYPYFTTLKNCYDHNKWGRDMYEPIKSIFFILIYISFQCNYMKNFCPEKVSFSKILLLKMGV